MRYLIRALALFLLLTSMAACATGPGPTNQLTGMTRAERNLCEETRSFEPYRPGECRETR
jgi:hypothetical protein